MRRFDIFLVGVYKEANLKNGKIWYIEDYDWEFFIID